jgi:hypothetical protein
MITHLKYSLISLLAVVAIALGLGRAALYPLARAFGSPPESELKHCRAAFEQLKYRLDSSRMWVEPVYFAEDLRRDSLHWRSDLAQNLVREAKVHTKAQLELAPITPQVDLTKFGHNQMRYLWTRSTAYARWLRAEPPGVDYVWCVEIFGFNGKVGAIQVYVFDAKGQVAYCRLFNSHQFGENLLLEGEDSIRLVVQSLFDDLRREPNKVFPPYGVG